jgi:8-oxo-dGTP diphosphatase
MSQGRISDRGQTSIPCVGAIVRDEAGRLLMIRRGQEPARGAWSLPGGRIEPGETDAQAVAREVAEETGLVVRVGELIGRITIPAPSGGVFDIADYAADVVGGRLRPGDDATEVAWVATDQLASRPTPPGFIETLTAWGVLSAMNPAVDHGKTDDKPD